MIEGQQEIIISTEIIPVIHTVTTYQTLLSVKNAVKCCIKKIFLISHGNHTYLELIELAKKVKDEYPNLWIGCNFLDLPAYKAISLDLDENIISGLWYDETLNKQQILQYRNYKGITFGGLAFKYQPQPLDLFNACQESRIICDVSTTSGQGTGLAINNDKLMHIRTYLGNFPMAIASGVSIDNIDYYKGVADYLLVASSITDNNEIINCERLKELIIKL